MTLQLWPAIDLSEGRAVRLYQGDYDREQVYAADPVAVARQFRDEGARHLHLVDLTGARDGAPVHAREIAEIAAIGGLAVELGGGLRSDEDVRRALEDWGVARVIVGTAAVEQPDWVAVLCARYPGRVAVGVDARDGCVATRGWRVDGGVAVAEMVKRANAWGAAALIFTEIRRDGAMAGPDLVALAEVLALARVPVVASGGVHSLDDLRRLGAIPPPAPAGVIVGRALYEGAFTVRTAVAALAAV